MGAPVIKLESQQPTAFNPAVLDDYGLDPYEFRLYLRVRRREDGPSGRGCDESVPSMAEACGVGTTKTRRALEVLVAAGLLTCQERPGQSTVYRTAPASAWRPAGDLPGIREAVHSGTPTPPSGGGVPQHEAVGTPTPGVDEGYPIRESPKGTPPLSPPRGESSGLPPWVDREAWELWQRYNRERGLTLKPSVIAAQLKKLDALRASEPQAAIIHRSIERQWRSFFPDTKRSPRSSLSPRRDVKPGTSVIDAKRQRDAAARAGETHERDA